MDRAAGGVGVHHRRSLVTAGGTPLHRRAARVLWGDGALAFATRARGRRLQLLHDTFPDLSRNRVLDLGGSPTTWQRATPPPAHVCCLNLIPSEHAGDGIDVVTGDATAFDDHVDVADFDLIFSNSLIEHVGGAGPRRRMAAAIVASGLPYWVQAPYRHFPLEPHWMLPFWQYLPRRLQVAIGSRYRYGGSTPEIRCHAYDVLAMLELPTVTDMQYLFPDAVLHRERFLGLTKSLIAIRTTGAARGGATS